MTISPNVIEQVKAELSMLDEQPIELEGRVLKPSSCYYLGNDPLHVLYNTNCPDSLKQQIEAILQKHVGEPDSGLKDIASNI